MIRNKLSKFLAKKGIMSKVFFNPIHNSKHFKNHKFEKNEMINTKKISECVLSLPMYPELTKNDIDEIVNAISEFFEQK